MRRDMCNFCLPGSLRRARIGAAAAGAASLALALAGVTAGPAQAAVRAPSDTGQAGPGATQTFGYIGPGTQTTVVPANTDFAEVRVIGAMGGATFDSPSHSRRTTGGDGALVTGRIGVQAGQVLSIQVGGYGGEADSNLNPGPGGWGPTGNGGRGGGAHSYVSVDGGGGGGATSLALGGTTVVIGGGGGGAGGRGFTSDIGAGGPGGSSGTTVDSGHNGKGPGGGAGGGGGSNGTPAGGSGGNGTSTGGGGGGGGAGYAGGGGGAGGGTGGGGGGGGGAGSSHYTSALQGASVVRGTAAGGNGQVQVTWVTATPECFDETVHIPVNTPSPGVRFHVHCSAVPAPTGFRLVQDTRHGGLYYPDFTTGTFDYWPFPDFRGTDYLVLEAVRGTVVSAPFTITLVVG
jgi:hypothetical protein